MPEMPKMQFTLVTATTTTATSFEWSFLKVENEVKEEAVVEVAVVDARIATVKDVDRRLDVLIIESK